MLYYLGLNEHADKIDKALDTTLADVHTRTADLGGKANTATFAQNIIKNLG
jgi:isocitrate dehydrogenase (NAD+)